MPDDYCPYRRESDCASAEEGVVDIAHRAAGDGSSVECFEVFGDGELWKTENGYEVVQFPRKTASGVKS
jgi:hypothetical protein